MWWHTLLVMSFIHILYEWMNDYNLDIFGWKPDKWEEILTRYKNVFCIDAALYLKKMVSRLQALYNVMSDRVQDSFIMSVPFLFLMFIIRSTPCIVLCYFLRLICKALNDTVCSAILRVRFELLGPLTYLLNFKDMFWKIIPVCSGWLKDMHGKRGRGGDPDKLLASVQHLMVLLHWRPGLGQSIVPGHGREHLKMPILGCTWRFYSLVKGCEAAWCWRPDRGWQKECWNRCMVFDTTVGGVQYIHHSIHHFLPQQVGGGA